MKLKVCGMKYNTQEVAELRPDYLGFIFWEPSQRFFNGEIPELPEGIKRIGVFVDAKIEEVLEKIATYNLDGIQLHGKESPEYCMDLRANFLSFRAQSRKKKVIELNEVSTALDQTEKQLTVIKVFSIKNNFDFGKLKPYEEVCDYFLFDTKGELPGGNGYTFNWEVLTDYPSSKPYFLSGGIGLEEIDSLKKFKKQPESKHCHAIDVNSKFEIEPGLKDIERLKNFKKSLNTDYRKL